MFFRGDVYGFVPLGFLIKPSAPNSESLLSHGTRTSIPIKRLLAVHGVNMPTEEAGGGVSGFGCRAERVSFALFSFG